MIFQYKLSHRLALIREILVIGTLALLACEIPTRQSLSDIVSQIIVSPSTVVVSTNQTADLVAVPLTSSGDTADAAVVWTTTGGTVSDSTMDHGVHRGRYKAPTTPGQYKVKAHSNGSSATDSATVTVTTVPVASVAVSPATAAILIGAAQQLTAVASDSAGNPLAGRAITWSSDNPAVAAVGLTGLTTGVAAGIATIRATCEGQTASAIVTVNPVPVASVTVSPTSATMRVGSAVQLTAVARDSAGGPLAGRPVTWTTSDLAVATVNANGSVTSNAVGSATITATSEGKSGTAAITVTAVPVASLTVNPASASVAVGATRQLSAVTKDSAGNTLTGRVITWSSSNTAVATVNSSGLVTGVAAGSATITATSEGKSGTATITVTNVPVASVTVNPATASIQTGSTQQLSAVTKDSAGNTLTGRVVTWSSSNSSVASVNSSGLVTGVTAGSATITATSEGKSGTATITVIVVPVASVTVSPASANIGVGGTRQLSAVTKDSGGNTLTGRVVTWSSSNTAVATVSATGLVRGVAAGSATITAISEGKSGTAAITVIVVPVASVTVSPASASISIGATWQFSAVTKDSAGNTLTGRVVTWASSNTAVATVSGTGLVTGVTAGSATITATSEGKSGNASITVTSGGGTGAPDPTLPTLLNTQYSVPTGTTINVPAGGNFQTALNNAQPGDQIVLAAGATYTGNFTLPVKTGSSWIIIRTSTPDAQLPAEGQRMKPSYAALLPKIVSPNTDGAISTAPGAHHYRFIGVEITTTSNLNYGLVLLGDGSPTQNTMAEVPHDLIFDRTYIHGNATGNVSRCVGFNSAASAVIDSYLSACHANGQDAQAIGGWNGPGPFKIVNNYLEASGENVMFGGADPSIPNLIPSDIEIRRNYFFKPLAWRASGAWTVKNLLELKLGRRVLIQGNIFENSWAAAQAGFAIVIWSVNQDGGATWSVTEDIWFRENIVRHAASGLQLTDRYDNPSSTTQRVRFDNNLWEDINGATWGGDGRLFQVASNTNALRAIKFYHQTGFSDGTLFTLVSGTTQQFEFGDNIAARGAYGIHADDAAEGVPALDRHTPGWLFASSLVIAAPTASYPTGNSYPASASAVGFVNYGGGDYRLAASSPYKGTATGGTDPGADFAALLSWTNGVDQ